MVKTFEFKLDINFPDYEELKAEIKECERKWKKNDFQYGSDVTYSRILLTFPFGNYRVYSSDDVHFKISFDEMKGGYVVNYKVFDLNKRGYEEFVEYATNKIRNAVKEW